MKKLIYILLVVVPTLMFGQGYVISNPYHGIEFDTSFKSALHMHTGESDGNQTVQQRIAGDRISSNGAVTYYGLVDYDFTILSVTDHDSYQDNDSPAEYWDSTSTWPLEKYDGLDTLVQDISYVWNDRDAWNMDTTSAYYSQLGTNGAFVIRGNELTDCSSGEGADGSYYTHINAYFCDLGWFTCPPNNFDTYFDSVEAKKGIAVFNHPGRHTAPASFYNGYYDTYGTDMIVGIEIHNYGDYQPTQNPRILWDSINSVREFNDLVNGFSNSDIHQSVGNTDQFRNYNHHYIDTLTETELRRNMVNGAFTASYEETPDYDGDAPSPKLTGVTITDSIITLTVTGTDSVRWFGAYSDTLLTATSIDISDYVTTSNFVRAELYNADGITYTNPFGIDTSLNYYVQDTSENSNASDANVGTDIALPWATLQKAFNTVDAGDTVFIRGGTWYPDSKYSASSGEAIYLNPEASIGNRGMEAYPIVYMAYENETPVFDFKDVLPYAPNGAGNSYLQGIKISHTAFTELHDITISNVKQNQANVDISGLEVYSSISSRIENVTVHDVAGKGLFVQPNYVVDYFLWQIRYPYSFNYLVNCDVYQCADSLARAVGDGAGNAADGIKCYGSSSDSSLLTMTIDANRSWFNSDDGFDVSLAGYLIVRNNWSFRNGYLIQGDGTGFKIGASSSIIKPRRFVHNNVSACNLSGFFPLEYSGYNRAVGGYYNNFSYKEEGTSYSPSNDNDIDPDTIFLVFRNNISYDVGGFPFSNVYTGYVESNNTWDYESGYPGYTQAYTLTDADFISLDTLQLDDARQADGSLPEITFGHLSSTSQLIDQGIQIPASDTIVYTIIFNGSAPDLGAFEYPTSTTRSYMKGSRPFMIGNRILQ